METRTVNSHEYKFKRLPPSGRAVWSKCVCVYECCVCACVCACGRLIVIDIDSGDNLDVDVPCVYIGVCVGGGGV